MASFSPKVFEISDKSSPERVFTSASKIWQAGPLLVVDQGGTQTAAQIYATLAAFVESRQTPGLGRGVTEILPTTA